MCLTNYKSFLQKLYISVCTYNSPTLWYTISHMHACYTWMQCCVHTVSPTLGHLCTTQMLESVLALEQVSFVFLCSVCETSSTNTFSHDMVQPTDGYQSYTWYTHMQNSFIYWIYTLKGQSQAIQPVRIVCLLFGYACLTVPNNT